MNVFILVIMCIIQGINLNFIFSFARLCPVVDTIAVSQVGCSQSYLCSLYPTMVSIISTAPWMFPTLIKVLGLDLGFDGHDALGKLSVHQQDSQWER